MSSLNITDAHPSALGSTNSDSNTSIDPTAPNDGTYPEQRHAGAVGYGPNYCKGVDTGEKLIGLAEQVKGKIFRNPELAEHGRERRTGELKKKEEADDNNPFHTASKDHSEVPPAKQHIDNN